MTLLVNVCRNSLVNGDGKLLIIHSSLFLAYTPRVLKLASLHASLMNATAGSITANGESKICNILYAIKLQLQGKIFHILHPII